MSGTNMAQVRPKGPQAGWLFAAAAVLVAVVGVAGGYGILQSNDRGTTGAGVVSPEPTNSGELVATPASFTASEACTETDNGTTKTVDGVVQSRYQQFECTSTSGDARLAGNGLAIMNWDEYPDGTSVAWGTRFIANDDGVWRGVWSAETTVGASVMEFETVLVGEGGYDGFVAPMTVRVSALGPSTWTGTILPAPPPINGHETCRTDAYGTETLTDGITAYRGVVLACTDKMTDPSVSGTGRLDVSIDMRADESADIWGTYVLTNDDGAWNGFAFGTIDVGYTTHRVEAVLTGSGDYAGMLYRMSLITDAAGTGYNVSALVVPRP